jgi:hypothetical protein
MRVIIADAEVGALTAAERIGLIVIYGLFVLYFVLLGIGAALVVWAVKPRFNIPSIAEH